MKFYKESSTNKWILGDIEGYPAGKCILYKFSNEEKVSIIRESDDKVLLTGSVKDFFYLNSSDALVNYTTYADFKTATADFFVKTAGGISSGIEVIDALGYEPLDKQVFEAHKPWVTSSHTLSPSKLAGSNASGKAVEIDGDAFASRYHTTPWYSAGTISSVGTTVTFIGLGTNLSNAIGYELQYPKLVVNGVSRIVTGRLSDTQITINSAFPTDLTNANYSLHALWLNNSRMWGSSGGTTYSIYDNGRFANVLEFSEGFQTFKKFKIWANTLISSKESGTIENDGAKIFFTDLTPTRRAFATEDNFVSYQPNPFYSTGTVSVSGTTVTIVGGTFSALMANNSKIRFSKGEERQITAYTDSTHVTIDRTTGSTVSGSTFAIYLTRLKDDGTNLIKTDNSGNQTII